MPETPAPANVWTAADDGRADASFAAQLTRRLGLWLHGTIAALFVAVLGAGAFGFILLAAILVMVLVIPFRAIWWHRRFGATHPVHSEMVKARRMIRHAIWLWLTSPLSFGIVMYLLLAIKLRGLSP